MRIDCKFAKEVLQKDVLNIASKQIFARWQAILSMFDFGIEIVNGSSNSLPSFFTREFLQGKQSCPQNYPEKKKGKLLPKPQNHKAYSNPKSTKENSQGIGMQTDPRDGHRPIDLVRTGN